MAAARMNSRVDDDDDDDQQSTQERMAQKDRSRLSSQAKAGMDEGISVARASATNNVTFDGVNVQGDVLRADVSLTCEASSPSHLVVPVGTFVRFTSAEPPSLEFQLNVFPPYMRSVSSDIFGGSEKFFEYFCAAAGTTTYEDTDFPGAKGTLEVVETPPALRGVAEVGFRKHEQCEQRARDKAAAAEAAEEGKGGSLGGAESDEDSSDGANYGSDALQSLGISSMSLKGKAHREGGPPPAPQRETAGAEGELDAARQSAVRESLRQYNEMRSSRRAAAASR